MGVLSEIIGMVEISADGTSLPCRSHVVGWSSDTLCCSYFRVLSRSSRIRLILSASKSNTSVDAVSYRFITNQTVGLA